MANGYIEPNKDFVDILRAFKNSKEYDPSYKELQEIYFWYMQNELIDHLLDFWKWFKSDVDNNFPGFYAYGNNIKFNSGKIGRIVIQVCEITYKVRWYIQIAK